MTIIDGFTGWAEAIPIAEQSAVTCARTVYSEWRARYGVLKQLHSNRCTQFESALFSQLCTSFGVDKTRKTAYRPESNGSASFSIARSSQCSGVPCSEGRTTGRFFYHPCFSRTGRPSQIRRALRHTASPSAERCACRLTLACPCPSPRAI